MYLLARWLFQLLPSVVDVRDAFVNVQHSGYASRVVGDPVNLELRKRRGVARLASNDVGLAGVMGDVDAGHARDVARNSHICAGHLWGSIQRDLRADL